MGLTVISRNAGGRKSFCDHWAAGGGSENAWGRQLAIYFAQDSASELKASKFSLKLFDRNSQTRFHKFMLAK